MGRGFATAFAIVLSACTGAPGIPSPIATLPLVSPTSGATLGMFQGVLHSQEGDVDRDGQRELVVLWKPGGAVDCRSTGRCSARIWVLRVSDDGVEYVWRGSAMSADVQAFGLVPDGPHHRIVTVEKPQGDAIAVCYDWTGFGFADASTPIDPRPSEFNVRCGEQAFRCKREGSRLDCTG